MEPLADKNVASEVMGHSILFIEDSKNEPDHFLFDFEKKPVVLEDLDHRTPK